METMGTLVNQEASRDKSEITNEIHKINETLDQLKEVIDLLAVRLEPVSVTPTDKAASFGGTGFCGAASQVTSPIGAELSNLLLRVELTRYRVNDLVSKLAI